VVGFGASALLVAVAVTAVAACTSRSAAGDSSAPAAAAAAGVATQAAPERATGAPGTQADSGAAAPDASGGSGEQRLATVPVDGTKVIKTADLTVRLEVQPVPATDDAAADRDANARARSDAVAASAASVRGIAGTAGGFVASADGGGSQMSITLRVPAEQYDAVLDKITGLGQVADRTESSQDVTAQIVDVNSRVASMTASVTRVRALLDQATSVADIISIESELATREADLEALQQQQAYLQGQVAMSTVTVSLSAVTLPGPGAVEPEPDSGFIAGIKEGWAGLLGFLSWSGAMVGAFLPFLPLVAVVAVALWWLARRLRRSSRTRRSDAPASTQDGTQEQAPEPAGVG